MSSCVNVHFKSDPETLLDESFHPFFSFVLCQTHVELIFKRPVFDPCVNLNVNDLEHTLERGLSNFGTQ